MITREAFESRQEKVGTLAILVHEKLSHAVDRYLEDDLDASGQPSHMQLRRQLAVLKGRYRCWSERQMIDEPWQGSDKLREALRDLQIARLEAWLDEHHGDAFAGDSDHPDVRRWLFNAAKRSRLRGSRPRQMAA